MCSEQEIREWITMLQDLIAEASERGVPWHAAAAQAELETLQRVLNDAD